jgi:hypothetical protein
MHTLIYFLPGVVLTLIGVLILLFSRNSFTTPESHYLKHPGEISIVASNVSSVFTVSGFWVLFIFSLKSWSVPSFIALQGGILFAYLFYGYLVLRKNADKTFLNFIIGPRPSAALRRVFFGLCLIAVLFELALGRLFVGSILESVGISPFVSTVSIFCIALATIMYTFKGGMYAVLIADTILFFACIVVSPLVFPPASVAQFNGLVDDLRSYEFSRLSVLDLVAYLSAGFYVFIMFLFHPDYWYRNIRLPYRSKKARICSVVASAILTSALLQLAYVLAVASRSPIDHQLLYNNQISKTYDFPDVISAILENPSVYPMVLVFLVLVSTFTTVNSLIITSAAGYFETGNAHASQYSQILRRVFEISIVLLLVSLLLNLPDTIFFALIAASCQTVVVCALYLGRCLRLTPTTMTYATLASVLIFALLAGLNLWLDAHLYYPLLGAIAGTASTLAMWTIIQMRGGK